MTTVQLSAASQQLSECIEPDRTGYLRWNDPTIRILRDAIFVPKAPGVGYERDPKWGLYESDGQLCAEASYSRGEGWGRLGQADRTSLSPSSHLPDQLYIYAGPCHIHYGHMLVSTLARLWTSISPRQNVKFLFHGDGSPQHWFSFSHFQAVMGGFSLTPSDLLCPNEPVRIGQIIVPNASFEELSHAYMAFGHMGTRAGDVILHHSKVDTGSGVVYFSKSKLKSGIWNIENEGEFEAYLQDSGVRIVHPETMSIREQIEALEGAETILGPAGSALHTALLARRALRVRALATGNVVVRNFRLIDGIKNTDAKYFYFNNFQNLGGDDRFTARFRIPNPKTAAAEYLARSIDA